MPGLESSEEKDLNAKNAHVQLSIILYYQYVKDTTLLLRPSVTGVSLMIMFLLFFQVQQTKLFEADVGKQECVMDW